jgi:hypothetical protein
MLFSLSHRAPTFVEADVHPSPPETAHHLFARQGTSQRTQFVPLDPGFFLGRPFSEPKAELELAMPIWHPGIAQAEGHLAKALSAAADLLGPGGPPVAAAGEGTASAPTAGGIL